VIHWIPDAQDRLVSFSKRVKKSIGFYQDQLAAHLKAHNVEATAIREFRTEVFVGEGFRMYVRAYVLDDRGKEHEAFVWA
jgi:hypothetical protein